MNGLMFYAQRDELCDLNIFYESNQEQSLVFLDAFDMGEFDKLEPLWSLCREQGIVFEFFKDSAVKHFLLPKMLSDVRACYGEIAQRKPFPTPGEPQTGAFLKMVRVLEVTIEARKGLVAVCD